MPIFTQSLFLAAALITTAVPNAILAESILFESGTLGPTGVPLSDIVDGTVAGTNVTGDVFVGVRFFIDQPVVTTRIGGSFIKIAGQGSFFGAIVELEDEADFPNSSDLLTPDVVGATLLEFPELSDEVFGDLARPLVPGWYALIFGSGLFGAIGEGGALRNNPDIGDPSYISFQTGATGWFNLSDLAGVVVFADHRFVVKGNVIPEPSSLSLALMVAICFVHRRTHFTK